SARFSDLRGDRVYRTGDRARRLPDGNIEFIGRNDDQVKIRGFRVELGEIEGVLRQQVSVANAVVVLRSEDDGNARLVAYVVLREGGYETAHAERATSESLGAWIASQLPDYMVPDAVVLLDAIPLTPNGKLDRLRLPAPETAGGGADTFVAPSSETEKQLAAIWSDVLKKEPIGLTDKFLDLGGHSLMAIRVLGKISKTFSVRLPLRTLFDHPTIEQLAIVVEKERARAAPAATIGARSRDAFRIDQNRPATTGDGGST
ncbi:MAG: phosphopantetheine-binding protein, partial [Gemmatimonadaceae bacterium]